MHRARSFLSRAILVALLCLGAVVGPEALAASPALAATPSPSPSLSTTLTYSVNITSYSTVDSTGAVTQDPSSTAILHVDCTSKPCVLKEFSDLPVKVPGTTHLVIPGKGDTCLGTFVGTETIDISIGKIFAVVLDYTGSGRQPCSGSNLQWSETDSIHEEIQGKLTSGDPCLVGGPCASAAPAGTSSTGGAHAPRAASTPSVLSRLQTTGQAVTVRNSLWAIAGAVVLVILIALPTQLFNSASEKASERIGAWWKRVRRQKAAIAGDAESPAAPKPPVAWSGWPLAALGVLGASVISAFVDPRFAFDAATLRTVLSILVSFILEVVIGWFVLLLIVRRTHPAASVSFDFKPLTLAVVAGAVLLTRITGFQPGIVFGLVAGIAFAGVVGTAKARVALIGLGYAFGIGILAWIGYSVIVSAAVAQTDAVLVFIQEALSSAAIAGMAALPIALLPMGALVGREVWQWNKIIWAVAYGVGLIGFFLVLMPMPFSWSTVPLSLWTWIGLYAGYAVAAVIIWLVATRPWTKSATPS